MALAKVGQKVKITNCSYANVWYKDYIGQEFIVEEVIERRGVNGSKGYYMLEDNNFCGVEEIDCVVVKEETMSEFKAGDKVVATATGGWYEVGDVLTLTKPYKDIGWYTVEKGEGFFVHTVQIEHYKQSPKAMLKNGMRVKCRNGKMYTYLDGYFTAINAIEDSAPFLSFLSVVETWHDSLSYYPKGGESEWDVMEIFAAPKVYDYFNYKIGAKSLWKREEKTAEQRELEALQKLSQEVADRIKVLQDKL